MSLNLGEKGSSKLEKGIGLWHLMPRNRRNMGEKNGKRSSQYHNQISIFNSVRGMGIWCFENKRFEARDEISREIFGFLMWLREIGDINTVFTFCLTIAAVD